MSVVRKIINANNQQNGGAVVSVAGARALNASEFLDSKHTLDSLTPSILIDDRGLTQRYDYVNYYSSLNPKRHLFARNEPGGIWDASGRYGASEAKRTWRRNLVTYSDQFSNAAWTKLNTTITANTQVAPDGTTTADTLTDDATAGLHYILHSGFVTETAGVKACRSFYVKRGTARYISISPINTFNFDENQLIFDFDTGTYTNSGSINSQYIDGYTTPENVGNGWWRLSFWNDSGQAGYGRVALAIFNGPLFSDGSYSGSGSTVHIWGFQYERDITAPTTYQRITDFSSDFIAAFPTHSLYQDVNGVTPVTAPGDPIGLQLDVSRGGLDNLGAELLTDPELNNVSAWTLDSGWSSSNGNLVLDNSAAAAQIFANGPQILTQGKAYLVEISITAYSGSGGIRLDCRPAAGGTGATSNATFTSTGTFKSIVVNTGANTRLSLRAPSNTQVTTATISRISIKEIPGTHRYQSVSGSRPVLARIPEGGRRNVLTWTEDVSNAAWTKSNATITLGVSDPNGGSTAMTLTASAANGLFYQIFSGLSGSVTNSIWIRRRTGTGVVRFYTGNAASTEQMQTVITSSWQRLSTATATAGGTVDRFGVICETSGDAVDVWQPQFERGSSATAYQKVTLTSNVTESGKRDCWGVLYDGSDDSFITASVDFNTWTQATRRNLLVDTESFGSATWTKTNTAVTDNAIADDEGNIAADLVACTLTGASCRIGVSQTVLSTQQYVLSVYAKAGTSPCIYLRMEGFDTSPGCYFDLQNGAVGTCSAGLTGEIESKGNGWYRCILKGFATTTDLIGNANVYICDALNNLTVTNGTGAYLTKIQLEAASTQTGYQRVGTDKMTVMSAVRKLSDAAAGCIVELSASMSLNNGSIRLLAPQSAGVDDYSFASKGTAQATATGTGMAAPATAVLVGIGDISGDSSIIRKNGVQANSSAVDQGSGNYGNYPLYFGRRGNAASLIYNGYEFCTIIRGVASTSNDIIQFEKYLANKAGITI